VSQVTNQGKRLQDQIRKRNTKQKSYQCTLYALHRSVAKQSSFFIQQRLQTIVIIQAGRQLPQEVMHQHRRLMATSKLIMVKLTVTKEVSVIILFKY